MATQIKTYSKLELLRLRPSQTSSELLKRPDFQNMLEITKSIPTKAEKSGSQENLDQVSTQQLLVDGLKAKEELRLAKKHRNFLRRERTRQRKALAKQQAALENSAKLETTNTENKKKLTPDYKKSTVKVVTETLLKTVPSHATVFLSRTESPRSWTNSKLRRAK